MGTIITLYLANFAILGVALLAIAIYIYVKYIR